MLPRIKLRFFLLLFLVSIFNTFIWQAEILFLVGWDGLQWLKQELLSILPISLIISIVSVIFPIQKLKKENSAKLYLCILSMFLLLVFSFYSSKGAITSLMYIDHLLIVKGEFDLIVIYALSKLVISLLLASFGVAIIYSMYIKSSILKTSIIILVALLLMPILSILTIKIIPAINGSTDYIHSVKMGYHIFWTSFAIIGGLNRRYFVKNNYSN